MNDNGKVVLKKTYENRLEERLDGCDMEYPLTEIDWGEPVGEEIW